MDVLNINELANAVKPVVLPGEEMRVTIIKEGKEKEQGIGYLDDGTMIVVEGGQKADRRDTRCQRHQRPADRPGQNDLCQDQRRIRRTGQRVQLTKASALIPAAGRGERFGRRTNKVFFEIAGKPILAHTLSVFETCDAIDEIIHRYRPS